MGDVHKEDFQKMKAILNEVFEGEEYLVDYKEIEVTEKPKIVGDPSLVRHVQPKVIKVTRTDVKEEIIEIGYDDQDHELRCSMSNSSFAYEDKIESSMSKFRDYMSKKK